MKNQTFNKIKFIDTVNYINYKLNNKINSDLNFLNLTLYYIDFEFYRIKEESLSTVLFIKHKGLPSINEIDMLKNISLKILNKKLSLTSSEKRHITKSCNQLQSFKKGKLIDYIKNDLPCKATEEGKVINLQLVFYR